MVGCVVACGCVCCLIVLVFGSLLICLRVVDCGWFVGCC